MNPPIVYDETIPNSHSTSKITKIVQSTVVSPFIRIEYFKVVAAGWNLVTGLFASRVPRFGN
jgi:hypothetical protein